jgi:hypothetical protein
MVVHIVMWKCVGSDRQEQQRNAVKIKELLDTLPGKVPQIVDFEAGLDKSCTPASYDVCLYSTFKSFEELRGYAEHPLHKDVAAAIGKLVAERHLVDYEK